MIESIKNDITEELTNIGKTDDGLISIRHLFEILDKYKDIDKYKDAWEELINSGCIDSPHIVKELEQKHNISKEME